MMEHDQVQAALLRLARHDWPREAPDQVETQVLEGFRRVRRQRFEEGAADFLQVLDAERTLLEAQDRLAAGRTGATTALVAVYRALGGAL